MPWYPPHEPACRPRGNGARRSVVRRSPEIGSRTELVEPAADRGLVNARNIELLVAHDEDWHAHDVAIEKRRIARHIDTLNVEARAAGQSAERRERFVAESAIRLLHEPDARHQFGFGPMGAGNLVPSR